jgi:hypothetical protein
LKVPEIDFSPDEISLIHDHRIFDLKAGIISKITRLFSGIEEQLHTDLESVKFDFPDNCRLRSGKISKGENYRNCPYLVLDYPRLFSKKDIFSIRTIFWWGHYFSNAFIIGGNSYHKYIDRFIEESERLRKTGWYLCVHHNPWKLELDDSNFRPFSDLSSAEIMEHMKRYTFLKVAAVYPVDQYRSLDTNTTAFTSRLFSYLA